MIPIDAIEWHEKSEYELMLDCLFTSSCFCKKVPFQYPLIFSKLFTLHFKNLNTVYFPLSVSNIFKQLNHSSDWFPPLCFIK